MGHGQRTPLHNENRSHYSEIIKITYPDVIHWTMHIQGSRQLSIAASHNQCVAPDDNL